MLCVLVVLLSLVLLSFLLFYRVRFFVLFLTTVILCCIILAVKRSLCLLILKLLPMRLRIFPCSPTYLVMLLFFLPCFFYTVTLIKSWRQ